MLVLVLVGLIYILWAWFNRNRKKDEPLVFSGGVMLLGNTLQYSGDSVKLWSTIKTMTKEALERGGVLKTTIGPRTFYIVASPEECLKVSNACLNKDATYSFAKPWYGDGLVTSDALQWKIHRKLLNPAFSQHVLDSFMDIFNNKSRCFLDNLKLKVGNKPFDHFEYTQQIALETICSTAMGVDFKEKNEANAKYVAAVETISNVFISRFQKFWLHNNFLFSLSSLKKKQDDCLKILLQTSNAILKKTKETFMNSLSNGKIVEDQTKGPKFKPFMELLLELAHVTNIFTDRQIREHIDTMVAAGLDTVSSVIMYTMLLVGSYPRVQKKIYDELKNIFGDEDRDVTKLDLSRLIYLEAVIKESLRFYPPVPVIARYIDKDVKLPNCTLYKGNSVFLFIYGINRHSMWGPDVEEFRPERWLEPSTLPDCSISIPGFGIGRRNCIGKMYSMMSMKVTLAHTFRNYIIHGDHTKLKLKVDILLKPVSGHYITVERRNN